MADAQIQVQVNVAGADQLKDLGNNVKDAGDNAKTAGSSFSELGKNITGIIASIGLFSNGLFTLSDAFDSVEKADLKVERANKTVREALQKRDEIQADLNKSTKEGLTIEKTATGQLVTTIDGHKKLVAQMQDGTLAIKESNGQWQRLVTVVRDAKGNLIATDGTFRSLVTTLKDGSKVYTDAAGNLQVLDDGQKKSKFTAQDLKDANTDLNTAYDRQALAVKQDEKAHAELIPRLVSGATQMVGGAAAAAQLGKDLVGMGGKAKSAGADLDTHNKSLATTLGTIGKIAIPLAAVAAAYLLLKNNVGGSRDALEQFGVQLGKTVPALQPLLSVIGDIGRGILGLGFGNLTKDLQALQNQLAPIFDTLKTKFGEMSNAFQTFIQQIIRGDLSGAFKTLVDSATKFATDIVNAIKSVDWSAVWQGLKDAFVSTLEWIKTASTNLGAAIINGIKTTDWTAVWQGLKDAFNSTVEAVKTAATTAGTTIMNAIKSVDWSATWQGIKDAFNSTVDFLKTSASTIGGAISTAVKTFDWKGTGEAVGSAIMAAIKFTSDAAGTILTALGTAIINGVKTTDWAKVGTELGTDIIKSIKWSDDIVSGIFDPLGKLIVSSTAKGIVNVSGNPLADALSERIKDEATKIKLPDWSKVAGDLWDGFTKAVSKFFGGQSASGTTGGQGIPSGLNVIKVPINVDTTQAVKDIGVLTSRFKEIPADKSTQFHAETVTAKANVDELLKTMGGAQNVLDTITKQTYTVKVTADTGSVLSDLGGIQNVVTTIAKTYTITVNAETVAAQTALGGIQNLVTTIAKTYNITVNAETVAAQTALGGIQNLVTTIAKTYTITVNAETVAAQTALGGIQNLVTTIAKTYTITVNAETAAAQQALGGIQNLVTTIAKTYTITVDAQTAAAQSALGGIQNLVTTITQRPYTITVNAETTAAQQAIGGLQNLVTTVARTYTITVNADTAAAEQKIANLRNQLASLNQGAVGGYPTSSPYGYPVAYGATGGVFSLDGRGFKKLYAAKGGSFVTTKQMRLGNLTVGEGGKPELISFMPSRKGRKNTSLLTVIPLPELHAQTGGTFGVGGSPSFGTSPTGLFGFTAGAPAAEPGAVIDYGAGIPAPVPTAGQGGPQLYPPSTEGAGTILVQGQGGVPVTQLGQYGTPGNPVTGGIGGLIPGAPSTGGFGGLPETGLPIEYGGGTAAQPQQAAAPTGGLESISPYQMASLAGASAAKEVSKSSGIADSADVTHLIGLIKSLLRAIMTKSNDTNLLVDGQKMASSVQKYIGSNAYGGM
jgi:hypothetical protein